MKGVTSEDKKWHKIHNGHWLWVGKEASKDAGQLKGKKGLGIISFTPTRFCLLLAHRIFWGYSMKVVPPGCFREYKMAVMASESPEEVKSIYEKIKDIKFDTFLYPEIATNDQNKK